MDAAPTARVRHGGAFALAVAVVVGLDQLTKQLAISGLDDGPFDLIGPAQLNLTFNDGAAFSLGGGYTRVIAVIAIVVSAVLARLGLRADHRAVAIGFGIVVGGALGNVVDRLFRAGDGFLGGRVVDFVDVGSWPVFNLADAALWVGIAVLVITSWRDEDASP